MARGEPVWGKKLVEPLPPNPRVAARRSGRVLTVRKALTSCFLHSDCSAELRLSAS